MSEPKTPIPLRILTLVDEIRAIARESLELAQIATEAHRYQAARFFTEYARADIALSDWIEGAARAYGQHLTEIHREFRTHLTERN